MNDCRCGFGYFQHRAAAQPTIPSGFERLQVATPALNVHCKQQTTQTFQKRRIYAITKCTDLCSRVLAASKISALDARELSSSNMRSNSNSLVILNCNIELRH